jgi:leucyl-tRNA synthetase
MEQQFDQMGAMFDWTKKVVTCDPGYYRWNQWLFLRMFERGLAYRKESLSTGTRSTRPCSPTSR